jgi:hypothetical protein
MKWRNRNVDLGFVDLDDDARKHDAIEKKLGIMEEYLAKEEGKKGKTRTISYTIVTNNLPLDWLPPMIKYKMVVRSGERCCRSSKENSWSSIFKR